MWLWFKTKLPAKWQAEQDKIQSQLIAQIWYEILTRSLLVYCNTLSYSGNRWIDWNGGYGILEDQSIQSWKRVDVSKVWRWSGIRKIFNWYFQNSINSKYTSEEDIGFPYQDSSPHSLLSTGIHQFIKFRGKKYGVQIVQPHTQWSSWKRWLSIAGTGVLRCHLSPARDKSTLVGAL